MTDGAFITIGGSWFQWSTILTEKAASRRFKWKRLWQSFRRWPRSSSKEGRVKNSSSGRSKRPVMMNWLQQIIRNICGRMLPIHPNLMDYKIRYTKTTWHPFFQIFVFLELNSIEPISKAKSCCPTYDSSIPFYQKQVWFAMLSIKPPRTGSFCSSSFLLDLPSVCSGRMTRFCHHDICS